MMDIGPVALIEKLQYTVHVDYCNKQKSKLTTEKANKIFFILFFECYVDVLLQLYISPSKDKTPVTSVTILTSVTSQESHGTRDKAPVTRGNREGGTRDL
jgi:hypothetical protein